MRRSLRCINNIYRAVISLDREQTEEITAEDGFILKTVGKGRETQFSDIFDRASRVCLAGSGHMLQRLRDPYGGVLWLSSSCVIRGSSWDQGKINNVKGD